MTVEPNNEPTGLAAADVRLYVLQPEKWTPRVKQTWDKEYCYNKNPGEDFFHLILRGEVYLQQDDERICLNCARRRDIISFDRLYWQRQSK